MRLWLKTLGTVLRAEQEFEERVGSAPERSPDHLKNGLWAAQQLLNSGSSKAYKRVLIFTNDPNPPGSGKQGDTFRQAPSLTVWSD